jgi:hypothetical protein
MADSTQFLRLDYQSQRDALIQRIQARYPGVWNDFLAGNFGVVILDAMAWTLSTFAYTVNKLAGENFIPTMTRRESAVRIGNLTAYTLANPAPATMLCQATVAGPAAEDVTLSAGTPVKTQGQAALTFELAQDYTILAGSTTPSTLIVRFDPATDGSQTISALISATNGAAYVDVLDPTLDLRQLVQPGQVLSVSSANITINAITTGTSEGVFNRLTLSAAWTLASGYYTGAVYERRVALVEGQTRVELFTGTGAALSCLLSTQPVIDQSVDVEIDGQTWTQVSYLAGQDGGAKVYQVKTFPTGQTAVQLGDDVIGKAAATGAQIQVTYRVGGGVAGNVAAGSVNNQILGRLTSGATVAVQLVNLSPAQGGAAAETIDTARRQIPAHTQAGDRAVTLADYEALATAWRSATAQIAFARASVDVSSGYSCKNVVNVTAWVQGNSGLEPVRDPSRSSLQLYLQTKACGTDYVSIIDGQVEIFPLAVRIQSAAGYSADDVEASVLAAVETLIAGIDPGAPVSYSALVSTVDAVLGVDNSQVAIPAGDSFTSTDDSVFSAPGAESSFEVELSSAGSGVFTAQLPFVPRYAWTISASLGSDRLSVGPDVAPGYARLSGGTLSTTADSRVNLSTGEVVLNVVGAAARFTIELASVQAYSSTRYADVFVTYEGDQGQSRRREIRQAIRLWGSGLAVGQTVFAYGGEGASITDVVENQAGVQPGTSTVRLGAPGGAERDDPTSTQLPVVRRVVINGYTD